jgi:hypothetical protein
MYIYCRHKPDNFTVSNSLLLFTLLQHCKKNYEVPQYALFTVNYYYDYYLSSHYVFQTERFRKFLASIYDS